MIQWKETYRIGVDIVDEQHKKLFDLAEEAEQLLGIPEHIDKFDEIVELLNELRDYVKYHFEEEEKILYEIQYKKFFNHRTLHNDFIEYIYELNLDDVDHHQNERILELLRMLTNWLVEHVLVEDREWSVVYKAKINNDDLKKVSL